MTHPPEVLMTIAALTSNLPAFREIQRAKRQFRVTVCARDTVRRRFRQLVQTPNGIFAVYKYVLPCGRKDGPYIDFLYGTVYARKYYLIGVPMYIEWTYGSIADRIFVRRGEQSVDI